MLTLPRLQLSQTRQLSLMFTDFAVGRWLLQLLLQLEALPFAVSKVDFDRKILITKPHVFLSFSARSIPFKVSVNFDANEMTSAASIAAMELLAEIQVETGTGTGGIVGFKLNYFQVAC